MGPPVAHATVMWDRIRGEASRWAVVGARDLGLIILSLAAIIVSIRTMHPIFANQPSVFQQLTSRAPIAAPAIRTVLTPEDTTQVGRLIAKPQFQRDSAAFAAALVKTGHMDPARADSVAFYAVRESYLRGIPPAVVFGVMLTENSLFIRTAMSNVGAVGLMQVYPKVWLNALSKRFGRNLTTDSTNLKYGVFILSQYIKSDSGKVTPQAVQSGLLHYNGCVLGSNTPNCHTYPSKVMNYVNKLGSSICASKTFYSCIAAPFIKGLFGG